MPTSKRGRRIATALACAALASAAVVGCDVSPAHELVPSSQRDGSLEDTGKPVSDPPDVGGAGDVGVSDLGPDTGSDPQPDASPVVGHEACWADEPEPFRFYPVGEGHVIFAGQVPVPVEGECLTHRLNLMFRLTPNDASPTGKGIDTITLIGESCNRCDRAVTVFGPDDIAFRGEAPRVIGDIYGLNFGVVSDQTRLIPLLCGMSCEEGSPFGPHGYFRFETPDRPSVDLTPREVLKWTLLYYRDSPGTPFSDVIRARTDQPQFSELVMFADVPTGRGGIEGPAFVAGCDELGFEMTGECRREPDSRRGVARVTFAVPDTPEIVLETLEWTWR